MSKLYHDIETDEIFTIEQLQNEYNELFSKGETETESFNGYMCNCLSKNGTLEIVK